MTRQISFIHLHSFLVDILGALTSGYTMQALHILRNAADQYRCHSGILWGLAQEMRIRECLQLRAFPCLVHDPCTAHAYLACHCPCASCSISTS